MCSSWTPQRYALGFPRPRRGFGDAEHGVDNMSSQIAWIGLFGIVICCGVSTTVISWLLFGPRSQRIVLSAPQLARRLRRARIVGWSAFSIWLIGFAPALLLSDPTRMNLSLYVGGSTLILFIVLFGCSDPREGDRVEDIVNRLDT